jgi:hypothetical protein
MCFKSQPTSTPPTTFVNSFVITSPPHSNAPCRTYLGATIAHLFLGIGNVNNVSFWHVCSYLGVSLREAFLARIQAIFLICRFSSDFPADPLFSRSTFTPQKKFSVSTSNRKQIHRKRGSHTSLRRLKLQNALLMQPSRE